MTRRLAAEAVGSALLAAVVIGSGITAARLSDSAGLALLVNAFATAGGLVALILALGRVSGAHFNPAVSIADAWLGGLPWRDAASYCAAQVVGAAAGAVVANAMFGQALVELSTRERAGGAVLLSEVVATFGLLLVILGCVRGARPGVTAFAVGAYIASAYFFTASTSFANPALTLARTLSNTFAGIRPADAALFLPCQLGGAMSATALMRWLIPSLTGDAADVVVPHTSGNG